MEMKKDGACVAFYSIKVTERSVAKVQNTFNAYNLPLCFTVSRNDSGAFYCRRIATGLFIIFNIFSTTGLFIIFNISLSQGILGLLTAIWGKQFFQCYNPMGEMMDMVTLTNSSFNFIRCSRCNFICFIRWPMRPHSPEVEVR